MLSRVNYFTRKQQLVTVKENSWSTPTGYTEKLCFQINWKQFINTEIEDKDNVVLQEIKERMIRSFLRIS